MRKERTTQFVYFLKQQLTSDSLCCEILIVAYLFQILCPTFYIEVFSSSIYLSIWTLLFVGTSLWAFSNDGIQSLPSKITNWQCITAFLLITGDLIYIIIPKENYLEITSSLAAYIIPVISIGSLVIVALIKFSTSLHRLLVVVQKEVIIQPLLIQEIAASPLPKQKNKIFIRNLIENKSIAQITANEYLSLVKDCQLLDPVLFIWLKKGEFKLQPRDIVLCVLIRLQKSKEEIISILGITNGSYRTMKSRVRSRLDIKETLDTFLQKLQ